MQNPPADVDFAPGSPLAGLAPLVVKDGVALGGLAEPQRALALGFVWAGLPRSPMTEPAVNQALKNQLTGAVQCLGTDHVELRRWLCDAGWLQRDGYGREYRRAPPDQVPVGWQPLARALEQAFDGQATASWTAVRRRERESQRQARRRAHESRAEGPAAA